MSPEEKIWPHQNLKKQWTPGPFQRTRKKAGRKRQHPLSKPTFIELERITKDLVNGCQTDETDDLGSFAAEEPRQKFSKVNFDKSEFVTPPNCSNQMSSESSETFIGNENASHPEPEETKNEKDESQNARKHSAEAESFTSGSHNAQKHGEQAKTTEDKSQNSWTHREQSKNAKDRSQNTDKHECKNQRSSESTFTLPIFCDNLEDQLLTNGCHTLNFLQLKSIDPYIPREELREIKAVRPDFHKGWLYDEVINFFLLDANN